MLKFRQVRARSISHNLANTARQASCQRRCRAELVNSLANISRSASTSASSPRQPEHVAVLGAGISGLTAAFYLGRRFPNTRITVLEEGSRAGGWIKSEKIDLGSKYGEVVLESGPRTLRPVSKSLLELTNLLGLQSRMIITPKSSPAAKNRYLYLSKPDGNGLKVLPSTPLSLFFSPFFFTLLSAVIKERYWPSNRTQPIPVPEHEKADLSLKMKVYDDESVDAFLTRRFGPKVARIFGSALVHGVFAADSRRLSLRATFPSLWEAEERGKGSVISGILRSEKTTQPTEYELGTMPDTVKDASVFSFQNGISELPNALMERLSTMPNVEVLLSHEVAGVKPKGEAVEIKLRDGEAVTVSSVISTLPLPKLSPLIDASAPIPYLTFNPTSTVTVVNLVFPCSPAELHPAGFGYLLPRPHNGYDSSDSNILGVVFDSCALSAQDKPGSSPITKITVMCGGPFGISSTSSGFSVDTLLSHLFKQLRRPRIEPIHVFTHEQTDCIPTPLVGHLERMASVKRVLTDGLWNGRLQISGAGVDGAGIADCVQAARKIALTTQIK